MLDRERTSLGTVTEHYRHQSLWLAISFVLNDDIPSVDPANDVSPQNVYETDIAVNPGVRSLMQKEYPHDLEMNGRTPETGKPKVPIPEKHIPQTAGESGKLGS